MNIHKLFIGLLLSLTCLSLTAGKLPIPNKFGGNFSLDSTLGEKASLSDWKGKVVLLNFGFTSCPDVCPMVLSKLTLIKNQLDKSFFGSETNNIQVIFVTVDPDRDTIQKMKSYLKAFHPKFVGLRGAQTEFSAILKSYGASAEIQNIDSKVEVSHSDYVYVIDQDGYVAGFYDAKTDYKALMEAVSDLL